MEDPNWPKFDILHICIMRKLVENCVHSFVKNPMNFMNLKALFVQTVTLPADPGGADAERLNGQRANFAAPGGGRERDEEEERRVGAGCNTRGRRRDLSACSAVGLGSGWRPQAHLECVEMSEMGSVGEVARGVIPARLQAVAPQYNCALALPPPPAPGTHLLSMRNVLNPPGGRGNCGGVRS